MVNEPSCISVFSGESTGRGRGDEGTPAERGWMGGQRFSDNDPCCPRSDYVWLTTKWSLGSCYVWDGSSRGLSSVPIGAGCLGQGPVMPESTRRISWHVHLAAVGSAAIIRLARDACVHMARKAGFAVYKEPRGGHEAFRAQEGGDMLVLGAGDHGRHLMSDVVISNPLAQTHVTGAAAADQFANEAAAKRKVGRYQVQAHQADWELLPLPFEVFGAMGK